MRKFKFGFSAAMASVVLLTTACDPLISQDPKDFFKDGKFPKQLEWIRTQMRELSQKNKDQIVARTEADAKRTDLLKVAVIDSGVDIAHPDLIDQIAYRVENGRIVGAGHDIMGNGKFGSHVLVNPGLFAFGAKAIENGKIVGPAESPLGLLKTINDRFRSIVVQGIQNDPELKSSLFANLKAETFTVLGLDDYRSDYSQDNIDDYNERKEKGELHGVDKTPKDGEDTAALIKRGWATMRQRVGAPDALQHAGRIEHADKFAQVVISAYKTLDQEFQYTKKLEDFSRFLLKLESPDKEPKESDVKDIHSRLKAAMEYVIYGVDLHDPISVLEREFRESSLYDGLDFAEAFEKYYRRQVSEVERMIADPETQEAARKDLKKWKSSLKVLYSAVQTLIELKHDPVAYRKFRSQLRREIIRTKHPYIADESNGNKHGTHVAGIIATQHPNIRIVPIRVTTQTVALHPTRQAEVNKELIEKFKSFMQTPYFAPLKAMISAEYGNVKMTDAAILTQVTHYLKANGLNSVFIKDVLNAVEAAGRDQVKLANVSLGTTFKKNYQLSQKRQSMAEDLFSEFARFAIGSTIKEKAPGTLFMIATGNDGGWVDGVSKSAFPVGITSLRLIKLAETQKLPIAPNNSMRNVLAVASINPNGTLTPFTNIMIDPNIPQIFSTGEEIMSPVPRKTRDAAFTQVMEKFKSLNLLSAKMEEVRSESIENKPRKEQIKSMFDSRADMAVILHLSDGLTTLIHLGAEVGRESLSGTSMATPTVTGLLAEYIIEKMKASGISSDQVYTHPDLSPEKIVADVMKMSRANKLTPMMTVQMLIDGIKQWKKAPAARIQQQRARAIFRPRCEAVYHF